MNEKKFERLAETTEQKPRQELIEDVLPRYYEARGENPTYETKRSIMIDGHEVAWMKYSGVVVHDITGRGQEGNEFSGHDLYCACHFKEDIGWKITDDGRIGTLSGPDKCLPKEAAQQLRYLELRDEYRGRELFGTWGRPGDEELETIILDLIEKAANDEFISSTGGAHFYGGYFYLQSVESVTGVSLKDIYAIADKMVEAKKIGLEGAVVQPYHEPNPPAWSAHTTYEQNGLRIVASSPIHSRMPQTWSFEVFEITDEIPKKLELDIPQVPMLHQPLFGPDVEDIDNAKKIMFNLAQNIQKD